MPKRKAGRPTEDFVTQSKKDFLLEMQLEYERLKLLFEAGNLKHEDVQKYMELAIKHIKDRKNDFTSAVRRAKG